MEKFNDIARAFRCGGTYLGEDPYGSGHINDTFRVSYDEAGGRRVHYIHQHLNRRVFGNIPALMDNIGRVTRHQRAKLEEAAIPDLGRRVLTLVPTVEGSDYHVDADGEYWRTFEFIENAIGHDVVENVGQAFEAARAFGEFQRQLADLPGRLHEIIPNFHNTRSRFQDLQQAIAEDSHGRVGEVGREIDFALAREEIVDVVLELMASGEIPERVTHNDTKLNNVLIDAFSGEGLCVIDLDTVMPGSVLYDVGDMIRTTTSTAAEDETELGGVAMEMAYFEAIVKGYLESAGGFLVPAERELIPFSGRLITFEVGIRFLTDYLRGDVYFKTHRDRHNLDRCRRQFRMVESIEEQMGAMRQVVDAC